MKLKVSPLGTVVFIGMEMVLARAKDSTESP
jgi:hypothetical protein